MATDSATLRAWRAHELFGAAAYPWACFHLWEQWSAFAGRGAFLERMSSTSHGGLATAAEIALGLVPAIAWIGLEARLRVQGPEPTDLARAMAEDGEAAKRLGLLARACSYVFYGWLLYHAAWLWLPKLIEGDEPLRTWLTLRDGMGTWLHATLHAIGITAFAVHLFAAVPRAALALGWAGGPEARRAARLSGAIMSLGLLLLYAQLAGWHAAGAGAIWSVD
jgi:hypothetical protein